MSVISGLLAAMRRRRLLIISLFALLGLGAVAGVYLKTPSYETRAKVLLNLGGRPISLSRAEVPTPAVAVQTVEALTTLSEVFSSRDVIERLIDEIGPEAFEGSPPANSTLQRTMGLVSDIKSAVLEALVAAQLVEPPSPHRALVSAVEERLSVFPVRQSQVIEIAFSWPNPSVPPLVLERLLGIYVERINALNAQTAEQTVLSDQAEQARLALEAANARLRELRKETGIVDPVREREVLTERIEKLSPLLGDGESGAPHGVVLGGSGGPGAEIAALRRQLNELRIERAGSLAQYTADSPTVRAVDAQIEAAAAALADERAKIELALRSDRERLGHVLAAEPQFAEAHRDVDLATEAYRTYRQAANDRHVMRLAEEELRLKIIDVPAARAQASGPSRFVLLIAGLIGAAMLACLLGLLADRLSAGLGDENAEGSDEPSPLPQTARLLRDVDEPPALRATTAKR